jgi:phage baseplate assembly protein W
MMVNKARFYGFNPPFFGGPQNVMSRQVDERLIKNDLLQLIMTLPGERVYRPTFGTMLRSIVFDTLSDSDLLILSADIKRAILANDERVSVTGIECQLSDDGQSVSIRVDVSLVNQPLTKFFIEISFNQNGSVTLTK